MRLLQVFALTVAAALAQTSLPRCSGGCYWNGKGCSSELAGKKCMQGAGNEPQPSSRPSTVPSPPSVAPPGPSVQQQQQQRQAEVQERSQRLQQQSAEQRRQMQQNMNAQALQHFEDVQRTIARMESRPAAGRGDFASTCRNGTLELMPSEMRDAESVNQITNICDQMAARIGNDNPGVGTSSSWNPMLDSQTTAPDATDRSARDAMRALDNADALKRDRTIEESIAKNAGPGLTLPDIPINACSPDAAAKLAEARDRLFRYTSALRDVESSRVDVLKGQSAGADAQKWGALTGVAQILIGTADAAVYAYDRFVPQNPPRGVEYIPVVGPSFKKLYEAGKSIGGAANALFAGDSPDTGKAVAGVANALDKVLPAQFGGKEMGTGKVVEGVGALLKSEYAKGTESGTEGFSKALEYAGLDTRRAGYLTGIGKLATTGEALGQNDPLKALEGGFGAASKFVKDSVQSKALEDLEQVAKLTHTVLEGADNIQQASGIAKDLNQVNFSAVASIDRNRSDLEIKIAKTNEEIGRLSECAEIRKP